MTKFPKAGHKLCAILRSHRRHARAQVRAFRTMLCLGVVSGSCLLAFWFVLRLILFVFRVLCCVVLQLWAMSSSSVFLVFRRFWDSALAGAEYPRCAVFRPRPGAEYRRLCGISPPGRGAEYRTMCGIPRRLGSGIRHVVRTSALACLPAGRLLASRSLAQGRPSGRSAAGFVRPEAGSSLGMRQLPYLRGVGREACGYGTSEYCRSCPQPKPRVLHSGDAQTLPSLGSIPEE